MLKWETDEERLLRHKRIPVKTKLEWLRQMNEFMSQCSSWKRLRKNIAKNARV